ncbi:MAG TPA: sulfotransferase [Gaiellaceae bacterium]|nr:sulfotransferase [Gaiellaceae bacterium]
MTETRNTTDGLEPIGVDLGVPGPHVIGATGGSGTRVVARIVRAAGLYIGEKLNPYEDAVELGFFSDRWIDRFVEAGDAAPDALYEEMTADLRAVLADHASGLPRDARAWGWKEPRSIYLLPFWNAALPGLRFLHFIRDGRDMAFSDNQQQLKKHGDAVLAGELRRARTSTRSIAVWGRINTQAADFGEGSLRDRYLRVRFEDLCAQPAETVARILAFFGLEGDAEAVARAEIRPPDTLGRWRQRRKGVVAELHREAGPALDRFGYTDR